MCRGVHFGREEGVMLLRKEHRGILDTAKLLSLLNLGYLRKMKITGSGGRRVGSSAKQRSMLPDHPDSVTDEPRFKV